MADLQGRKVFKVFNQDFIVDERYNVTKELGQGAYGIVWYVPSQSSGHTISYVQGRWTFIQQQDGPLYLSVHLLIRDTAAQRPTTILAKALPSKKSPMFSARRSLQSGLCERLSFYSISEVTAT